VPVVLPVLLLVVVVAPPVEPPGVGPEHVIIPNSSVTMLIINENVNLLIVYSPVCLLRSVPHPLARPTACASPAGRAAEARSCAHRRLQRLVVRLGLASSRVVSKHGLHA
jgi:hypothetical protein